MHQRLIMMMSGGGTPPTVTTNAATSVTGTTVTLNGTGNPNGVASFGYFRYSGSDPGTGNDTSGTRAPVSSGSDTALGNGITGVPYSINLTGLQPAVTYYFWAIAYNPGGKVYGSILSFLMEATAPTTVTTAATNITSTTATLNGTANPNGSSALGWFRYDTTPPSPPNNTSGTRAPISGASFLGGGTSPVGFSEGITGLTADTVYYFWALGLNNIDFGYGTVLSFRTLLGGAHDEFDAGSLDTGLWSADAGVTQTGGKIEITGTTSKALRTVNSYDFTSKKMQVKVTDHPAANAAYGQQFIAGDSGAFDSYHMIQIYNGNIAYQNKQGGTYHAPFSMTYDPVAHLYIRLNMASGNVTFETSPDNITWTSQYSEALVDAITAYYAYLRMYNTGTSITFKFDNFDSTL